MFDVLLDRMPHFGVVGEPNYVRCIQLNALKVLPISFAPGAHLSDPAEAADPPPSPRGTHS